MFVISNYTSLRGAFPARHPLARTGTAAQHRKASLQALCLQSPADDRNKSGNNDAGRKILNCFTSPAMKNLYFLSIAYIEVNK